MRIDGGRRRRSLRFLDGFFFGFLAHLRDALAQRDFLFLAVRLANRAIAILNRILRGQLDDLVSSHDGARSEWRGPRREHPWRRGGGRQSTAAMVAELGAVVGL